MRRAICGLLLAGMTSMTPAFAVPQGQTRTGALLCGPAQLTAHTQYLDVSGHDRQVLSQALSLSLPPAAPRTLAHDGRPLRQPFLPQQPVLDAAATGWACLASRDGRHYVYVAYTCTESPVRPGCAGTRREWARLFDTQGKPLNAGHPRSGPRTPALMRRLGLGRHLEDGVALQDIAP